MNDLQRLHERVTRKVSKEDSILIGKIVDRFDAAFPNTFSRAALILRFFEVHPVVPLELERMAEWPYISDITHDIGGMMNRWDNEKLEFRDCFHPRFAEEQ